MAEKLMTEVKMTEEQENNVRQCKGITGIRFYQL